MAARKAASARGVEADVIALESSLIFQISTLARVLDRQTARLVSTRFGLSVAEYRVLAHAVAHPDPTVRTIGARTLIDKTQVSRAVASLETKSLIGRLPSNDGRSPVFHATRSGRALIRQIVPLRMAQERELLAHFDDDITGGLREALTALLDAYRAESDLLAEPRVRRPRTAGTDS